MYCFLQDNFQTAAIGFKDWLFLVVLPIPMVLFDEIRKFITRRYGKNKKRGGK